MRHILNTIVLNSFFNFKRLLTFLFILMPFFSFSQNKLKLWYKKPAKVWTEALPLGKGAFRCNDFWWCQTGTYTVK
jgi:alpha-L-fucosidase 2